MKKVLEEMFRHDVLLYRWAQSSFDLAKSAGICTDVLHMHYRPVNGSECASVPGEVLRPVYGRLIFEGGKYIGYERTDSLTDEFVDVEFTKELIEVPIRSEQYKWFRKMETRTVKVLDKRFREGFREETVSVMKGYLRPVRFSADNFRDSQERLRAYQLMLQRLAVKGKVLIGNLKSREAILYYNTPKVLHRLFGYKFLLDKNPVKLVDLWRTTSKMEFLGAEGRDTIRVRIVKAMTLKDVLPEDCGEIGDIPVNDGCAFTRWEIHVSPFQNAAARGRGDAVGPERRLSGGAQIRINAPEYGLAVKANTYPSIYHYMQLCHLWGFGPYEQDMIMTLDNVKNKNNTHKHGDIVHLPVDKVRIIGVTSRRGKSSYGVQLLCMGGEVGKFNDILVEKGMPDKARLIRDAMKGNLDSVIKVIFGQSRTGKFEDNREMYGKALFAIKKDKQGNYLKFFEEGEYKIPLYQSNASMMALRVNRMIADEILKYRVSDVGAYIMPNMDLDLLEYLLSKQYRKAYRFFVPSGNPRVRRALIGHAKKGISPYLHTLIGGNPVVWPGSIFTGMPLREGAVEALEHWRDTGEFDYDPEKDTSRIIFNVSKDCFEISNASAYMAFRDFDGDMCTVCFTNIPEPPMNYRTVIRPEPPEAKMEAPKTMGGLVRHLAEVSRMIAQAQLDTGLVDLECRRIYVRRLLANKPLSKGEAFLMGCKREEMISGMKWSTVSETDAVQTLRDQFDIRDFRIPIRPLEYALVHRNAGISREENPNPTDAQILNKRLDIINTAGYRFNEKVPQWAGLKELRGVRIVTYHLDSEYIRRVMVKRWDNVPNKADYDLTTEVGEKQWKDAFGMVQRYKSMKSRMDLPFKLYVNDEGDCPSIQGDATTLVNVYDSTSRGLIQAWSIDKDSAAKAEGFRQLGRDIRSWLKGVVGYPVKDDKGNVVGYVEGQMGSYGPIYEQFLAVYICMIGFGSPEPKPDRRRTSRGGSALWYLSDEALMFAAYMYNPLNPELERARKVLRSLGTVDESASDRSVPDEELDVVDVIM